jgi:hypothetical protein
VNKKTVLVLAGFALLCILIGVVIGGAITTYRISGRGNILFPPKIGVYADSTCSVPVTEIDWGTSSPGDVVKKGVYVCNEGSGSVTLSFSTANWSPVQAAQYLTLSWNYTGQTITMTMYVVFQLSVSSSLTSASGITSFSFDIVIGI